MNENIDPDEGMQNFEDLLGKIVRKKPDENTAEVIEEQQDQEVDDD